MGGGGNYGSVGNYSSTGGSSNYLSYLGVPDTQQQQYPMQVVHQNEPQEMFTGGVPLKAQPGSEFFTKPQPGWQNFYPASKFPLKKPGVPADPNTDWYGFPLGEPGQQIKFPPPPFVKGGQPYKML